MGSNRTFAYNSGAAIAGTEQVGYIAVGLEGSKKYNGYLWWPGPDEDLGYIICRTSSVAKTAAQGTIPVAAPTLGFWRSTLKTEASFVTLCNRIFPGNAFTTGYDAALFLGGNDFWTSYPPIDNADALAYYDSVTTNHGVIGYNQALALDQLFKDLQSTELESGGGVYLYDVLEGFYPMLGIGSAQGINGNGNSAYDLSFYGGWEFGLLGIRGNGANTYAETGKVYVPITSEELWNTHFSIYGTVQYNPSGPADLSIGGGSERTVSIALKGNVGSDGRYEYECGSGTGVAGYSGDFVTISCDLGNATYAYQNGASPSPSSAGSVAYLYSTQSLYFGLGTFVTSGCQTNVGVSANTYGWASFGGYMSTTDMDNYQTIVNAFMTSIGRNTY